MANDFRVRDLNASVSINTIDMFSQRYVCSGDLLSLEDWTAFESGNILIGERTCLTNNVSSYIIDYDGGATFQTVTAPNYYGPVIFSDNITVNGTNSTAPNQKASSSGSLLTTKETVKGYLYGYMNNFRIDNLATWPASVGSGGTWNLANFGRSGMVSGSTGSSTTRVRSLSPWNANFNPYGLTSVGMTFIAYYGPVGTNVMWRVQSQSSDSALQLNSRGYGIELSGSGSNLIARACAHAGAGSPSFSSWSTVHNATTTPVIQFFVWTETGRVNAAWRKRSAPAGFGWGSWSSTITTTGGPLTADVAGNNWNIIGCQNAAASVSQGIFYIYDFISTCGINEPFS